MGWLFVLGLVLLLVGDALWRLDQDVLLRRQVGVKKICRCVVLRARGSYGLVFVFLSGQLSGQIRPVQVEVQEVLADSFVEFAGQK